MVDAEKYENMDAAKFMISIQEEDADIATSIKNALSE
jgi:hypothetical protein